MMDFLHPHFEAPQWLWLAVAGPVALVLLQRYAARRRRQQLAQIATPHFVAELTASHSPLRRRFKHALLVLGLACIGIALARPQWGELELGAQWLGEDVVFALDCSRSMTATDIRPSRLQRAKLAIRDFVRQNGRGRVGLVAFSGGAFLQCPLTFDHEAFDDALEAMDATILPVPGTDIGRALSEANHAMDPKRKRKLVVLVTDGEDLEQSGVQTAKNLATNGIVVFTVGVGSPAGTEIQVLNQAGQMELLRDTKGEIVRSRLDEETLRNIATATGGSYFPLGPRSDGLIRVRTAFAALERTGDNQRPRRLGVERFHLFIGLALILLVVESLLGTRRRIRPALPPAALIGIGVVLLGSGFNLTAGEDEASKPFGNLIGGVDEVMQRARETANAATNSARAAATNTTPIAPPQPRPTSARELYNLGTQNLTAGKLPEAESLFQAALGRQAEDIQPVALYNLGQVRFAQGAEILKKATSARGDTARTQNAADAGVRAIQTAEAALADGEMQKLIAAYLHGRGARKELRTAGQAIIRAMDKYASTLLKWRRALGDFRSAAELNPADTNALQNAAVIEKEIARLVDSLREMQQAAMKAAQAAAKLNSLMDQMKGMIPKEAMPPGAAGDEEEEEGPDGTLPESLRGLFEPKPKENRDVVQPLTPDEAARMLDGYKLGEGRRLPMSSPDPSAQQKSGPDRRPAKPW